MKGLFYGMIFKKWTNAAGWLGSFLLIFAGKLFLISQFGNAVPYWDQWDAEAANLYLPYLKGSLKFGDLFLPHNEHRILWTRLLALCLFVVNGQWDPLLAMVAQAAFFSFIVAMAIILIPKPTDCQGRLFLWVVGTVMFLFPFSWENTLWGFQSQFYFTLFFGFVGIHGTLRSILLGRHWFAGLACLWAALFTTAGGFLAAMSVAGILALQTILYPKDRMPRVTALCLVLLPAICGVLLRVQVPGHTPLQAKGMDEFFSFFFQLAAWPTTSSFVSCLFLFPFFWLGWTVLTKKCPSDDWTWLLLGLGSWHLLEMAALAYGRANSGLASRYTDSLAFGLIPVLAIIQSLCKDSKLGQASMFRFYTAAVVISVLCGFWRDFPISLQVMITRKDLGSIQAAHLISFLKSDRPEVLYGHPFQHIPYPDAGRLVSLLREKELRQALPTALHPGLEPVNAFLEGDLFLKDGGLFPGTPPVEGKPYFGSYGSEGDRNTGILRLEYQNPPSTAKLEFSVAGYPRGEGMELFLETKDGRKDALPIYQNPGEKWQSVVLYNPRQPFAVVAKDGSSKYWLAVCSPTPLGCLSAWVNWILAHVWLVGGLGTFLFLWNLCANLRGLSPP